MENDSLEISNRLDQICGLWEELADFDASRLEEALFHLMKTVCSWIQADNAMWIGGVRMMRGAAAQGDGQHGWRGRVVLNWPPSPAIHIRNERGAKEQDTKPSMTTTAITAKAGHFRAHRLHDGFVDLVAFEQTPQYRTLHESFGVTDRMWIVLPINADTESYFVFDRHHRAEHFSVKDQELAGLVVRGLKWFQRQLMLHHGLLMAGEPLTPAERKVLSLLLTDKSEKQIAAKLDQSFHTTHRHVTNIFRRFGVNGRAGLMALWLGGR